MTYVLLLMLMKTILVYQPVLSQPPPLHPPPICIWGNLGGTTVINGLYTAQPTTYNNKPYYQKSAGSDCTTFYVYWTQYNDWGISATLDSGDYAFCNSSTTVRTCNTWYTYKGTAYVINSDVQVFSDSCPSWNCDAITIPNAPNGCDTFDVALGNNIWKNSKTNRWWYFEPYYFSWHCSQYEPTCGDYYTAWTTMGWTDISKGQNTPIQLDYPNSNTYALNCIDSSSTSSTQNPTNVPTKITKSPTNNPITHSPTNVVPTNNPITVVPTKSPTNNPNTNAPTNIPTATATNNPTNTDVPTSAPGEGSVHVENINTTYTTTLLFESNTFNGDNSQFWTVFIIFLVLILICITCLGVVFRYKYKKDKASEEVKNTGVYAVDANAIQNKQEMCRDRVYTESQYIDDGGEDIQVDDNAGGTPKNDESVVQVDIFHMKMNDSGMADPETPVEDTFNTQTINGEVMQENEGDETIVQKHAVKEWLDQKVRLPQYYDVFLKNGFDSLDIIIVITKDKELTEIGIVLKGHQLKIMTEIKALRNQMNCYKD